MAKHTTPLFLLAFLAIAGAIVAGVAATGRGPAQTSPDEDPERAERGKTKPREQAHERDEGAEGVARRYALAARNWTPATYRAGWKTQIGLSAGRYRTELVAALPGAAELRSLTRDRASSRARVIRSDVDGGAGPGRARAFVTLDELTTANEVQIAGRTLNEVRLVRREGSWRVVGWTMLPGGADAPLP